MKKEVSIDYKKLNNLIANMAGTNGSALNDYIELDPTAPVIKFRIKPEVTVDDIPKDFDIDRALSKATQTLTLINPDADNHNSEDEQIINPEKLILADIDSIIPQTRDLDTPRVLVEGDSWCRLPEFFPISILFPQAIGTQLMRRQGIQTRNIAHWGDTLRSVFQRKEYLTHIEQFKPQYLVLSAGGNDLQKHLLEYVHPYSSNRAVHDYLTQAGYQLLFSIRENYTALFKEVIALKPDIKILVHSYDYPKPWAGEDSQYIGRYLMQKDIPEELMPKVIRPVIDRMNKRVSEAAAQFPQVTLVDFRNRTQDIRWFDDMHPNTYGYRRLTDRLMGYIR